MMKHAIIRSLYNRAEDNKLVLGTHGNGAFLGAVSLTTGLPDEPVNSNFIKITYPTFSRGDLFYSIGSVTGIIEMNVKVFALNGQLLYQADLPYRDGVLHLQGLAAGSYVAVFAASKNKYRYISRFNKY